MRPFIHALRPSTKVVSSWPATALPMLAASLCLGGCFVQAELPSLTITRQNLQFPGTTSLAPDQASAAQGAAVPPGFDPSVIPDEFADAEAIAQAQDLIESGALEGGLVAMTQSFEQDQELEFPDGLDSSLWPLGAKLTARSGATDLSFLQSFDVSVRCASGELPAARLFSYTASAGDVGAEIVTDSHEHVNVVDYWHCAQTFYDVHVIGTLPEEPWNVDVSFELSGKFKVDF